MKSGQQRVWWSAEKLSVVSRAQRASGLSVQAYCRREGINVSSFYRWRDRVAPGRSPWRGERCKTQPSSEFIALPALSTSAPLTLRFDLGGGLSLTVSR